MAQVASKRSWAESTLSHSHNTSSRRPPPPPRWPDYVIPQNNNPATAAREPTIDIAPGPAPQQKPSLRFNIADWGLHPGVVAAYASKKVTKLFPWQAAALESGEDGGNLIYTAPTSGGKSLVADILMFRRILLPSQINQPCPKLGRALVILPYISIVSEKTETLRSLLKPMRATVRGYFGSDEMRSPLGPGAETVAVCTMEKANVAINRLLEEGRLGEICCVVIDELHMVSDASRGQSLEILLSKLLYSNEGEQIQIIGMSATMGGLESLRSWVGDARLFVTNYRPVQLQEYAVFGGKIFKKKSNFTTPPGNTQSQIAIKYRLGADTCPLEYCRELKPLSSAAITIATAVNNNNKNSNRNTIRNRDPDGLCSLVSEVTTEGHSVLVFCVSRKSCEAAALLLADVLPRPTDPARNAELYDARLKVISDIETALGAPLSEELKTAILAGVAWHHAALTQEERTGIENGYRSGALQVLTATSTLAAGVNLPARRVILRSLKQGGSTVVERAQYLQIVGRAGRAGHSEVGESFIIGAGPPETGKEWTETCKLITAPVPELQSQILNERQEGEILRNGGQVPNNSISKHIERLLLESIASGAVNSSADIVSLLENTFAAKQRSPQAVASAAKHALQILCVEKSILESYGENFSQWRTTQRGKSVFDSALPLETGLSLYNELLSAQQGVAIDTPLHIIFLGLLALNHGFQICSWPQWYKVLENLPSGHRKVADAVNVRIEDALALMSGGRAQEKVAERHARFAAALVLMEAIDEDISLDEIVHRYGKENFVTRGGVSRGFIQRLQSDGAKTLAMASFLCDSAGWWPLATVFAHISATVFAGVRPELLPLMSVPNMTAVYARALHKGGITSPEMLNSMPEEKIINAIAAGVAGQMRGKRSSGAGNNRNNNGDANRAAKGIAIRAAKTLIASAREYIIYCVENGLPIPGYSLEKVKNENERAAMKIFKERQDQGGGVTAAGGELQIIRRPEIATASERSAIPSNLTIINGQLEKRPMPNADGLSPLIAEHAARAANLKKGGVCKIIEIRDSASDEALIEFLTVWLQQQTFSIALSKTMPKGVNKNQKIQSTPQVRGIAICWKPEQSYYLEFTELHRERKLPKECENIFGGTLLGAVAKILSNSAAYKLVFGVREVMEDLKNAGIPHIGPPETILDIKVAAQLLQTPAASISNNNKENLAAGAESEKEEEITLLTAIHSILPPDTKLKVAFMVHKGVSVTCRDALATLVLLKPSTALLLSRNLQNCFTSLDMPATVALSQGSISILPSSDTLPLKSASRLDCLLDPFISYKFGACTVSASQLTLHQEISSGLVLPSAVQGIPVAAWCHPSELIPFKSSATSPASASATTTNNKEPLLVWGIIAEVSDPNKRICTALDFSTSDQMPALNDSGRLSRAAPQIKITVASLPTNPDTDPDTALRIPCSIQVVRTADQVWRIDHGGKDDNAAAILPPSIIEKISSFPDITQSLPCSIWCWRFNTNGPPATSEGNQLTLHLPSETLLSIEMPFAKLAVLAHLTSERDLQMACTSETPWYRVAACWSVAVKGVTAALGSPTLISAGTAAIVVDSLFKGLSDKQLAERLYINQFQAAAVVHSFLEAFPQVKIWQEAVFATWDRTQEALTLAGRLYRIKDTSKGDTKKKAKLHKKVLAATLAGSLEDFYCATAVTVSQSLKECGVIVGHNGMVVIVKVEKGSEEAAAQAIRQRLTRGVVVSDVAINIPVLCCIMSGEGMNPLSRKHVFV